MENFQPSQFGKYLLMDKIAVGGMAELYRAKIIGVQGFEKLIAVKMILPHLSLEEDLVSSFICEAKLAAYLQHQNIVQIYDFGRMEDRYFIAMEYLFGKDLKGIIRKSRERQKPINLENSLFIISQVCKGLDYAHNLRDFTGKHLAVIHRDIGPQNIFITYDGEVKIIDFGIAKAAIQDRTTQAGSIKGKVAYMSPEQAEGKDMDHRSDIYAIGIMLYELVLQKRMFSGDIYKVFAKVRESDFDPPERVNKDLPPKLYEILHKALARDPEKRYQSSGDMLTDIDAFMAERSFRPNERTFSAYIRGLFQVEADAEMTAIQEAAKLKSATGPDMPSSPGTVINRQKTLALPRKEIESGPKKRPRFIYAAAAIMVVIIVVLLGFQYLKVPFSKIDDVVSSFYKKDVTPDIEQAQPAAPDLIVPADPYLTPLRDAEALLEKEQFEDAVSLYEGLLIKDPDIKDRIAAPYSRALFGLAQKVSEIDQAGARDMVLKALETDPDNIEGRLWIGLYYTKEKDFPQAVENYERVISLDPNIPKAYFNLGYIFAELKDYIKAEEMYNNTVRLSPPFLDEALFNLAVIQRKLGKTDQCIKSLEEAIRVNPDNETARKYLERINK